MSSPGRLNVQEIVVQLMEIMVHDQTEGTYKPEEDPGSVFEKATMKQMFDLAEKLAPFVWEMQERR